MSKGYICIAQNSQDVDYLKMTYLQALSCKLTQKKHASFSIVVDSDTLAQMTDNHRAVFDNIILLKNDLAVTSKIKQQNESQIFSLSPYKETIKTEADMLFTADVSWLWSVYGQYVLNLTQSVYTYDHKLVTSRSQRKLFDDNQLPNIYSAWTYFSYDRLSKKFFDTMRSIMDDWAWYRDQYLINCRYETPRTDEVYALAAKILNIPLIDTNFGFVHMKPAVQNLTGNTWSNQVYFELQDDYAPVIGFYKQFRPFHYVEKTFVSDEILDRYEYGYKKLILG